MYLCLSNTDLIENSFGCARSLVAGVGSNPTVMDYCNGLNTQILTVNCVSSKSNAGRNSFAVPYKFDLPDAR